VGLVFGLGYESARKVNDARYSTQREERTLGEMENHLLNLRLELSKLDTEARIRGRIEAGTQGVMLPPTELRLRNERDAVTKLLRRSTRFGSRTPPRSRRRAASSTSTSKTPRTRAGTRSKASPTTATSTSS